MRNWVFFYKQIVNIYFSSDIISKPYLLTFFLDIYTIYVWLSMGNRKHILVVGWLTSVFLRRFSFHFQQVILPHCQTDFEIWTLRFRRIFLVHMDFLLHATYLSHQYLTKVYFNEFVANALRDNIGSKKISLILKN